MKRFFYLANQMMCEVDFRGVFLQVNPAFEKALGYDAQDLLTYYIFDFVHEADRPTALHELEAASTDGLVREFETRYRLRDGTYKSFSWHVLPDIEQQFFLITAIDVTVASPDFQFLHDQATSLSASNRDLIRSNSDLEQFAYVASHDLREPLRAIAGCLDMLCRRLGDSLDEKGRYLIQNAIDGATRMQTLMDDLLLYGSVGSTGLNISPISSADALQSALQQLQILVKERNASVTASDLPIVPADKTQLVQLFQNLISNAIKFCRDRPPEVAIACKEDHDAVVFSVSDNGIGISPEGKDRIFRIFYRENTRREFPGTGIGLAICRKVVERHGGTIWFESTPGQGTTFFFNLPKVSV